MLSTVSPCGARQGAVEGKSGRGWGWVDPQKEINAAVTAVENNMSSLTQIAATQGRDVEETLTELKAEKDLITNMGLDEDTDEV